MVVLTSVFQHPVEPNNVSEQANILLAEQSGYLKGIREKK
jgi:hypothetical protein